MASSELFESALGAAGQDQLSKGEAQPGAGGHAGASGATHVHAGVVIIAAA